MINHILSGIRGKLLLLALLPVLGFSVVTVITFNKAERINSSITDITQNIMPTLETMSEIRKSRNASRQWFWSAIFHSQDEATRKAHVEKSIAEFGILEKNFAAYEKNPFNEFEQKAYPEIKALLPEYNKVFHQIADSIKTGTPAALTEAAKLMDTRYLEIGTKISAYCEKVTEDYNKQAHDQSAASMEAQAALKTASLWTSIVSSLILVLITLLFSENIVRQVSKISTHLLGTGQRVRESIEQLSHAGASLSESSTSAAASLEETVASLEEMTSMVKMNSDNAHTAASLSKSSYEAAEKGETEIKKLITSMQQISQSSKKIEEIINVIDDIAFQTNLLALNASVEAARAGEQGKGFAVVAEAVRNLAQRSASAAKDISGLIKESVSQIESGSQVADKSGEVLAEIVNSVKKVADLNNEIAAASSQQSTGINQISQAMTALDQSSQSNAASAEEIAATTTEIKGQAEQVETEVLELNSFVLGPHAKNSSAA